MITSILRLDLGSLTMEEEVEQKKLNFIHHLIYLRDIQESESLASEIFDLQNRYGFPGLVSEFKGLRGCPLITLASFWQSQTPLPPC